jgi:long-chain-alcohol oxidase
VVNYTTSFRTPDDVRAEWAGLGAEQFAGEEYTRSLDAVCTRLGVNTDHDVAAPRDAEMQRGLEKLGWHVEAMPRNVLGCEMGARAQRVMVTRGRAAGAVQTPALLRRSGLTNPNVGRHLRLHPVSVVWARYEEEVRPFTGAPQSRFSREHRDLDGRGYGVIYETAPTTPALAAGFIPWHGAQEHADRMRQLPHLVPLVAITRDFDSGEVKVGRDGEPRVRYRLSQYDAAHLQRGIAGAALIAEASGALEALSCHQKPISFEPGRRSSPEQFAAETAVAGYAPGRCGIGSLHIMGSARMGGSSQMSAANPDGETWDLPGLVVADGSAFPTASGVNPMISIESIAHMNASRLTARLV